MLRFEPEIGLVFDCPLLEEELLGPVSNVRVGEVGVALALGVEPVFCSSWVEEEEVVGAVVRAVGDGILEGIKCARTLIKGKKKMKT